MMNEENGDCAGEPTSEVAISPKDNDTQKKTTRRKIIRTLFGAGVILFMGMQASQKGPAFLDVQLISGTDVKGASSYLTGYCFGYMVGALLAGFLYDILNNKVILVCLPMVVASFLLGLTPWCTSYSTMLLAHITSAVALGIPETTINADQFSTWDGKSDSAFQFLSFTYSLGGVIGPLYTEPFLAPKWNRSGNNDAPSRVHTGNSITTNVSELIYDAQNSSVPFVSIEQAASNSSFKGNITHSEDPPESRLYLAYMISGLFGILFSIPFFIIGCKFYFKSSQKEIKKKESEEKPVHKRLTLKAYIILTAICAVLLFFYTMTEDSFNMYLPMFLVSHLSWTKEEGALISSLYWGVSTVSKLISVPLVRRFDIGIMILISCAGIVVSSTGFLLASHYHVNALVWISSSCFAMSQSLMFGGCFSWLDAHILKLDGKATAIIMICAASGAMAGPLVLGVTMEEISFMVFPYIELINAFITSCIFAFIFFILEPYVTKKYGPVRPELKEDDVLSENETNMEMITEEEKSVVRDDDDNDNDDGRCINGEIPESHGLVST